MKLTKLNLCLALTLSLSLTGCLAPGAIKEGTSGDRPTAAGQTMPQGTGAVELNVNWPQRPEGYRTQDIPFRAETVEITLSPKAGAFILDAQGAPMKDAQGNAVTLSATASAFVSTSPGGPLYPGSYVKEWILKAQRDLKIEAILRDAEGHEVGRADQVIDVIAGYRAQVVLPIKVAGAPEITSVTPARFKPGDTLTITGKNFKNPDPSKQQWLAAAYLIPAGHVPADRPTPPTSTLMQRAFAFSLSAVEVTSDTTLTVQVSEYGNNGSMGQILGDYFANLGTQQLKLGVLVDNASSNLLDVSIPGASLEATVSLKPGAQAPAQAAEATSSLDLTAGDFLVPTAMDSTWQYEVYKHGTMAYTSTIRVVDEARHVAYQDTTGWNSGFNAPDKTPIPFVWELRAMGAIQPLGVEDVPWKGEILQARRFYFNSGFPITNWGGFSAYDPGEVGTACEAWVLPGIGVYKLRTTKIELSTYTNERGETVTDTKPHVFEYRLKDAPSQPQVP